MENTGDLRARARQWRRIAERYAPGLARTLLRLALPMIIAIAGVAAAATTPPSTPSHEPPPALEERLPPLPPNCGAATWLPGRWLWTGIAGTEWQWQHGRWVEWPPNRTASDSDQSPSKPNGWAWNEDDWH